MKHIPFQLELIPDLPTIVGNKDYTDFKKLLEQIDEFLNYSGVEEKAVQTFIESKIITNASDECSISIAALNPSQLNRSKRLAVKALRCNIVRHLKQDSFRGFAVRLADSALLQRFCGITKIEKISIPAKSTLENYSKYFQKEDMRSWTTKMFESISKGKEKDLQPFLETPIDLSEVFFDTTCLKVNIHFPVDWVLLKDGVITLMKAVVLIRNQGLKNRMNDPLKFIRTINKLSIEMTHCRRTKDSKKSRKKILRKMKKLCVIISNHAQVHRELLENNREKTQYSQKRAIRILKRIDHVLDQLPEAIRQAHERIIGERQVPSKEKILSLYESDIHVIIRGKAGAEVEFGNTLLLAEQSDGLIIDWNLLKDISPGDASLMMDSLKRMDSNMNGYKPSTVVGDRGFWSKKMSQLLETENIKNGICPKSVSELTIKLRDKDFVRLQTRRAQTEGRIAILKNNFLRNPINSKGFNHQKLSVAWAVFSHNLWVIARLPQAKEKEEPLSIAA